MKAVHEEVANGTFKPNRENDQLARALGNKEHPGRTWGFIHEENAQKNWSYNIWWRLFNKEIKENTKRLRQELEERIKNHSMLSLAHRFGPSAPLINLDDLATYLECLAKLFLTVFHLFLVFQTEVSSTSELTDLEISGFQEDLSGFIIDQVVSTKGVHHLL